MSAGDLRELLRFERRTVAGDDGYGNTIYAWSPLFEAPGRVKPLREDERVAQQRVEGVINFEITIRWQAQCDELMAADRAVDMRTGKLFNLTQAINADEHRRYLSIVATNEGEGE
jgi:SPP1 family predicted phage head-tail adaptor